MSDLGAGSSGGPAEFELAFVLLGLVLRVLSVGVLVVREVFLAYL